jgi:tripartite-type tricarboxylate transporter receptor subunit TctC
MFPNFWNGPRRTGVDAGLLRKRARRFTSLPALPRLTARPQASSRPLLLLLAILTFFSSFSSSGAAEAADSPPVALCPSGTVTLILPDGEQSPVYRLYEAAAKAFKEELFLDLKPVVRAGRGGGRALNRLLEEKDDGCFLGVLQFPSFVFQANLRDRLYDDAEVAPAAVTASVPNILWVAESGPLRTLDDFVAAARAEAGKGELRLVTAGAGSYTDQHLATLQLERAAGISLSYLPFLGAAESAEAVRTGKATACWGYAVPSALMPGLRPLAVAAARRSPLWPKTPTFQETGRNVLNEAWFGLGIRASAPESVRAKCAESFTRVMRNAALREDMAALGFTPSDAAPGSIEARRLLERLREDALRLSAAYPLISRQERLPGRFGPAAP